MLRIASARAAALPLRRARALSAMVDPEKIVKDIENTLEVFKSMRDNPPPPPAYTTAMIAEDAKTGTINVSQVGDIFGSHEPEQKKVLMTIAARINEIARKLKETPSNEIDWPMWEERYTSIGMGKFITEFKADALAREAALDAELQEQQAALKAEWDAEIKKVMDGPGGLTAAYEEMNSRCQRIQNETISELETMKQEAADIDSLTIASILEKNPEWKAAIEEDIANNIWDPGHIPDKIKEAALAAGQANDKEAIAA